MINDKMGAKELPLAGIITDDGNSETFNTGEWCSKHPIYLSDKCKHCMLCIPACPDSAIKHNNDKMLGFDYSRCKGCGVCAKVCPFKAITMQSENGGEI